jgi:hypothetical protein
MTNLEQPEQAQQELTVFERLVHTWEKRKGGGGGFFCKLKPGEYLPT